MQIRQEIDWCWNTFKENWEKYVVVYAIVVALNFVISIPSWVLYVFLRIGMIGIWEEGLNFILIFIAVYILVMVAVVLCTMIAQGAAFACTRDIMGGRYKSAKDMWKNAKRYWGGFVIIGLWMGLIWFVVFAIFGFLCAIPFLFMDLEKDVATVIFSICLITAIATLVLIILGIFLAIIDFLAKVIFLTDECSPTRAVGRSVKMLFSNFKELSKAGMVYMLAMLVGSIIPMVGALVVLPIFMIYLFKFYYTHSDHSHKYNVLSTNIPKRAGSHNEYDKYR